MVRINERSDGMEYLVFINRDTMEKECRRLFNCKYVMNHCRQQGRQSFTTTEFYDHLLFLIIKVNLCSMTM